MPYFLAISLFKNKNGFTRPWPSCCLSLVTVSVPRAWALGSPRALPSPHPYSVTTPHPRRLPTLVLNLLPNATTLPLPLHPSGATTVPLSPELLPPCITVAICDPLPHKVKGICQKHKADLVLPCLAPSRPSHCS